jgi:hypothetical protein
LLSRCLNGSACDKELGEAAIVRLRLDPSGSRDDAADGGPSTLVSCWGPGCSGAGDAVGQCQLASNGQGMVRLHSDESADLAKRMAHPTGKGWRGCTQTRALIELSSWRMCHSRRGARVRQLMQAGCLLGCKGAWPSTCAWVAHLHRRPPSGCTCLPGPRTHRLHK